MVESRGAVGDGITYRSHLSRVSSARLRHVQYFGARLAHDPNLGDESDAGAGTHQVARATGLFRRVNLRVQARTYDWHAGAGRCGESRLSDAPRLPPRES